MGVYLRLGDIDVSRFITENNYSAEEKPLFDKESEFINIYGEKVRERIGREITVSAVLMDVDDLTAAGISGLLSSGCVNVMYSAPNECNAVMDTVRQKLSLDRVYKGEKFWKAEFELHGYVRDCL